MVKAPPLAQPTRVKLVVVGPKSCGKSTFVHAIAHNEGGEPGETLGVDLVAVERTVGKEMVKVSFFDLSGDALYKDVRTEFYRDQHGVVLCLDLSNRDSRAALGTLVDECAAEISGLPKYVVGLK